MGIEISEEKRAFKSTSVIFLLTSFLVLGLLISRVFIGGQGTSKRANLNERAQIVGLQVMQIYFDQRELMRQVPAVPETTGGRGIASIAEIEVSMGFPLEGVMGVDPWGHPFQYKIKESSHPGEAARILIYSKGENNSRIAEASEGYDLVLDLPIPST